MPTPGQIAVLQFGNDNLWHYSFLTPSALSTITVNSTAGTWALTRLGSASGQLPTVPIPLSCMDLEVVAPIVFDPTAKTIGLSFGGTTLQYVRGDGTVATLPTYAAQIQSDWNEANNALADFIKNKPTLGTAAATNSSAYDASGAASAAQAASQPLALILTNLGALSGSTGLPRKTGAATWTLDTSTFLTGNQNLTLTGPVTGSGTTAITTAIGSGQVTNAMLANSGITIAGTSTALGGTITLDTITGLSSTGFVKRTGGNTLAIDGNTYLTANQSISVTGDATGSGQTSIALTLKNTGTASTYAGVTTDAQGRVTAGTSQSVNNAPTVPLVTTAAAANGTQVSATQTALVSYSVTTSSTSTIAGASSVVAVLEICSTNSATAANWLTIATVQNGQTLTLAIALQSIETISQVLAGVVPAGYYRRIRYTVTGTGSATFASGQEVLT